MRMADLLEFPPPVTGGMRALSPLPRPTVPLDAYNHVLDSYDKTWRALKAAKEDIARLKAELTSERRRGPSRYLVYATWLAVGLFIGHLATRAAG